jgi:arylsulfatase A-like enzyme
VNHVVALYDGEVARVGALLQSFMHGYSEVFEEEASERWADTLFVFASDHGEELWQRNGYWGHSKSVYSSVLQVPLFLHHPRSLTGARVLDEVVELQDVMPTLLDWFDVPAPADVRGRSLLPLVDSYVRRPFESRPAFGTWSDRIFTVRTGRWRLVWNPEGREPVEEPPGPYPVPALALFDVERDPLERHDCSADHPEVVAELRDELHRWMEGLEPCLVGDRGLSDERRAALGELGYLGADAEPPERGR